MATVPADIPVTCPELLTVPMAVLPLDQAPPVDVVASGVEVPTQIVTGVEGVIGSGAVFTVTVARV